MDGVVQKRNWRAGILRGGPGPAAVPQSGYGNSLPWFAHAEKRFYDGRTARGSCIRKFQDILRFCPTIQRVNAETGHGFQP